MSINARTASVTRRSRSAGRGWRYEREGQQGQRQLPTSSAARREALRELFHVPRRPLHVGCRAHHAELCLQPVGAQEVTRPAPAVGGDHYEKGGIQPIEFTEANGLGFHEGNIVKYVTRWRHKDGVKDLEKAKWYIERLIELETPKVRSAWATGELCRFCGNYLAPGETQADAEERLRRGERCHVPRCALCGVAFGAEETVIRGPEGGRYHPVCPINPSLKKP